MQNYAKSYAKSCTLAYEVSMNDANISLILDKESMIQTSVRQCELYLLDKDQEKLYHASIEFIGHGASDLSCL